jgi:hypothetical protein
MRGGFGSKKLSENEESSILADQMHNYKGVDGVRDKPSCKDGWGGAAVLRKGDNMSRGVWAVNPRHLP